MRYVVAGGAGFIGGHLCRRLLADGQEVLCIDNYATGRPETVRELLAHPRFTFEERDVCEPLDFRPADGIFNLASPASPPQYRRLALETMRVNATGTLRLLEWAEAVGARFVQASTSEVYGDPEVHPQTEDYWGSVNPTGERACYDEGKRFAEALVMEFVRSRGLNARIARIFNTYGPGMQLDDGRVVSNFILQALSGEPLTIYGDGSQTRSLCYVADTVDALVRLMLGGGLRGEVVNVGSEDETTVGALAAAVAETLGGKLELAYRELPADDPRRRRPDLARARSLLGWEPVTPLPQGLLATLQDFRRRRGDPSIDDSWQGLREAVPHAAGVVRDGELLPCGATGASALDAPETFEERDPGGMRQLLAGFPGQVREAWVAGLQWDLPPEFERPSEVVILGMGGSGIAGDIVASLGLLRSTVPIRSIHGYAPPLIAPGALVIACSFSGETEETVSAFGEALRVPGPRMVITTGGRLAGLAEAAGAPAFRFDCPGPPRTAVGYGLLPILAVLSRLGVLELDEGDVAGALAALREDAEAFGTGVPEQANHAKRLARRLCGRMPLVIGADFLAVAATRWGADLSENAKQWSFAAGIPEFNHGGIAALQHANDASSRLSVLLLDGDAAHPRSRFQLELAVRSLAAADVDHEVVTVAGDGPLETMLRAMHLGNWVSFYLAMLNAVDPFDISSVDGLKRGLALVPAEVSA